MVSKDNRKDNRIKKHQRIRVGNRPRNALVFYFFFNRISCRRQSIFNIPAGLVPSGGTYTGRSSRSSASGSGAPGTRLYTVMIKGRSSCRQRTYSSAREYTAARPARRTRSPSTRQYTTPPRGDA